VLGCDEPFDSELGGVLFRVFLAGEDGSVVPKGGGGVFADADEASEEVEAGAGFVVVGAGVGGVGLSVFWGGRQYGRVFSMFLRGCWIYKPNSWPTQFLPPRSTLTGGSGSAYVRRSLASMTLFVVGLPVTIVVASILLGPFDFFCVCPAASLAASALASISSSALSQSARSIKSSPALRV
jgi:hypothetical protein